MRSILLIISLIVAVDSRAQFVLNGSALELGDDCIRLTPALITQTGSAWYPDKINLLEDFRVETEINLGSSDAGADGIAFVLQPVSTAIGASGGGLGYLGVTPSVIVEFDTFLNTEYSDPACDHTAIISNGNPAHTGVTSLAGPVNILPASCNAEDNTEHLVSIRWSAALTRLDVLIDCSPRLSYTGNIVNTIFGGDSLVFFGFTAATGAFSNEQIICYRRLDFDFAPATMTICTGDTVMLDAPPGFSNYTWTPALAMDDSTLENPSVWPEVSVTYMVSYEDDCGELFTDSVQVNVPAALTMPDLPADTTLCEGDSIILGEASLPGYTYLWSDGSTASSIAVNTSGTYTLTVSDGFCDQGVSAMVLFQPYPTLNLTMDILLWCPGDQLLLETTGSADAVLWTTGASTSDIAVETPGWYGFTALTNGCSVSDSVLVFPDEVCDCRPVFPNAFTPNGDGLNDRFRVLNTISCPFSERFSLQVFNRWGEMVFMARDSRIAWDGTRRGADAEAGVYVYTAFLYFPFEGLRRINGTVTLVR